MNIIFITNYTNEIGYGHLSRVLNIKNYFYSKGIKDIKIILPHDNIKPNDLTDIKLVESFSSKSLEKIIKGYDIVIIDTIENKYNELRWINPSIYFIVSITLFLFDTKNRFENISFFPCFKNDEIIEENKKIIYTGKSYLTFREEFKNCSFIVKNEANRVLITMGGSDPYNITLKTIQALMNEKELNITILLSKKSNSYNQINNLTVKLPNIKLIDYTEKISNLFLENDIAIINGGLTRYEATIVGIPFIAISIHQKQFDITEELTNNNVNSINLGIVDKISTEDIINITSDLLLDYEKRNNISKRMKKLIKLHGNKNIYKLIFENFINYEKNKKNTSNNY
jgi:spore coat polysaccharide biosynthesis predicted glycosyltransferase SpsG